MKSPAAEIETPLTTLITGPARLAPDSLQAAPSAPELVAPRRRGRPVEMAPETVLERIRGLSERREGLFRVHRTHPALYARARRLPGLRPDRSPRVRARRADAASRPAADVCNVAVTQPIHSGNSPPFRVP